MYTKRNPRDILGADATIMYFSKFIFYLCDVWGDFMFWLIFWSCGTIFMRYKLQENATLLLPENGTLNRAVPYYILAAFTCLAKTICVF